MPHSKPVYCSLAGPEGGFGLQRTQAGVTDLIVDIIHSPNRTANAKQAINQMFDGNGKATGKYTYLNLPVWHASSGNGQKSVSLFYTLFGPTAQVVAIGEHKTSSSYTIEHGPADTLFAAGKLISL